MAFGQNIKSTASPQPGTSNQPFPVGNLPPFVPVTTKITDDYISAINDTSKIITALEEQNFLIEGYIFFINSAFRQINNNLSALTEIQKLQTKAIADLETSRTVENFSKIQSAALKSMQASNQIKNNNFGVSLNKETPEMPSTTQQLRDSVDDSIKLNIFSNSLGLVGSVVTSILTSTATLIGKSEIYKGISSWMDRQKNIILGSAIPPSAKEIASNAASIAGDPTLK